MTVYKGKTTVVTQDNLRLRLIHRGHRPTGFDMDDFRSGGMTSSWSPDGLSRNMSTVEAGGTR